MKITEDNFRKFYFGCAAEYFIQSEFYTFGYEAYKAQPDIGFDLCVTNSGLTKFLKEKQKTYYIQIKTRFMHNNQTVFFIEQEDFEVLLGYGNSVLVCVLQCPILKYDTNPFHYNRDTFRLDSMYDDLDQSYVEWRITQEEELSVIEAEKRYPINGYDKIYFWMNDKHLQRLKSEKIFFEVTKYNKCFVCLKVLLEDYIIKFCYGDNERKSLVSELSSVKYLVDDTVCCREELNKGKMFFEDKYQ